MRNRVRKRINRNKLMFRIKVTDAADCTDINCSGTVLDCGEKIIRGERMTAFVCVFDCKCFTGIFLEIEHDFIFYTHPKIPGTIRKDTIKIQWLIDFIFRERRTQRT